MSKYLQQILRRAHAVEVVPMLSCAEFLREHFLVMFIVYVKLEDETEVVAYFSPYQ